jgi:hypothetical protein
MRSGRNRAYNYESGGGKEMPLPLVGIANHVGNAAKIVASVKIAFPAVSPFL